jgi:microcystin-dependent protein
MADPFLGEIRMFAGNFPPRGWAFCDGQILEIDHYPALFGVLGNTYGGNGTTTFALPNLRGRIPVHMHQGIGLTDREIGQRLGSERVALTYQQMPPHRHEAASLDPPSLGSPGGNLLAAMGSDHIYGTDSTTNLATEASIPQGEGQPHENLMPCRCIHFIIAIFGRNPSQHEPRDPSQDPSQRPPEDPSQGLPQGRFRHPGAR